MTPPNVIQGFFDPAITVRKVKTWREFRNFINLPKRIYKTYPAWRSTSFLQNIRKFSKTKNPFFEHSDAAFFVAYKNRVPIGRIAAIHNGPHEAIYHDRLGFFGFFECIPHFPVAKQLLHAAEQWCHFRGKTALYGPVNFTIHENYGLLISGFQESPFILSSYNPPYYSSLLEKLKFKPVKDLYTHQIQLKNPVPILSKLDILRKQHSGDHSIQLRKVSSRNLKKQLTACFKEIFNPEWQQQRGFTPLSQHELQFLFKSYLKWAIPEWVFIAESQNTIVGCMIILPNVNEIMHRFDGIKAPFARLFAPFVKTQLKTAKCVLLMVKNTFRHFGYEIQLLQKAVEQLARDGINTLELGWVPKDHVAQIHTLNKFHLHPSKVYRLYSKKIVYEHDANYTHPRGTLYSFDSYNKS